jgi:SIR2-like domain
LSASLPTEFVSLLRQERDRVIPFVGAGLAIPAGVAELPIGVVAAARARGVDVASDSLLSVTTALEGSLGTDGTKALVAEVVQSLVVTSTPTLRALAQVPGRAVATFNYDDAIERAARDVGLVPRPVLPDTATAFRTAPEGEVMVVHLHGLADAPQSLVLPGRTSEELNANAAFMTLLRSLWARHVVVYFGFRLGPAETHVRAALGWLASELPDAEPQRLLLPASELDLRGEELEVLRANPLFEAVPYPDSPGHEAAHQAALLLAPANEPATDVVASRAPEPKPHFLEPALLRADPGTEQSSLRAQAISAELGHGDDEWVTPEALLASRQAVVIASPGMGKTQLLLAAGRRASGGEKPLFANLRPLAGLLDDEDDPLRAFARLAGDAAAFAEETPVATSDRLENASYIFLLDGLDEVALGRRRAVVAALRTAVRRWPQHGYIVATRPTAEAPELLEAEFTPFRIVDSGYWGLRYLAHRQLPEDRIREFQRHAPAAGDLLGIPMYAAHIGERLASGEPLPQRPIDLIVDALHALAREEARKQGQSPDAFASWLQRLAVGMELRGRTEGTAAELAEVAGPLAEDPETLRHRLIEAALLRDSPDEVAFPEQTVQEALCAGAMLACHDVAAALHETALAKLDGEQVLRGDIEHTLDLVWENADAQQRATLRELDPLRWARTIRADLGEDEARDALDVLWRWHLHRRVWMETAREGQLRGAREAIELILDKHASAVAERRDELIAATSHKEATLRGNAIEVLAGLGRDDQTADWLLPRLNDGNGVVRRFAAETAARLEIDEALDDLQRVFPTLADELEQDAYGTAMVTLAPADRLTQVAGLVRQRGRPWRRASATLAARLSLGDALEVLAAGLPDHDAWRTFLSTVVEQHPPEHWQPEQVEELARLLIVNDVQPYELPAEPGVSRIAAIQPEAALRGVHAAAEETQPIVFTDLFFLRDLDRDLLRAESDGPLGDAFSFFLRQLETIPAARPTDQAQPERHTATVKQRGTERATIVGCRLDDGTINEDRVPADPLHWPIDELTDGQRHRLTELVEAWWPNTPLHQAIRVTPTGVEGNNAAMAAVCAAAALDLPLTDDRWLEVLAAGGAMRLRPETVAWLHRQHRPAVDERAAALIADLDDEWHLYYLVGAFPELSEAAARAFTDRARLIEDPYRLDAVLRPVAQSGHGALLASLRGADLADEQRRVLLQALAAGGDVDAQIELVADAIERVNAGRAPDALSWYEAVRDDRVIDALGELLEVLGPSGGPRDELQRSVTAGLASSRSLRALRVYDRLMESDSFEAAFFWYPRQELARLLATEQVLLRLPPSLNETTRMLEGF